MRLVRLLAFALAVQVLLAHPLAGERAVAGIGGASVEVSAHLGHCEDMPAAAGAAEAEACPFHCALGAPALDGGMPPFVASSMRAELAIHRFAAALPAAKRPPSREHHGPRAPPSAA